MRRTRSLGGIENTGSYIPVHSLGADDVTPAPTLAPVAPSSVAFNLRDAVNSEPVSTAAALALTYHGYKRTGSLVWALIYGVLGKTFPIEAVPIALAQGFGKKKECP